MTITQTLSHSLIHSLTHTFINTITHLRVLAFILHILEQQGEVPVDMLLPSRPDNSVSRQHVLRCVDASVSSFLCV